MCLASARGHQVRPRGTHPVFWLGLWAPFKAPWHQHGTGGGTRPVSWLGSWVQCKAPRHASWNGWWHASRVLARLMGTMQGRGARVVARVVARVPCLSSARGHHARPRGTHHGTGGGTHHGMGRGTCCVSWLGSWAQCKAPTHASWNGRWHASRVLTRLMGTMHGPVAHVIARAMSSVTCLGSARGHHARPRGTHHGMSGGTCHVS